MRLSLPARRLPRLCLAVAALVVLFSLFGFLILPGIVQSQLEKRLAVELGRPVSIAHVRLNPYALSITIEGFQIKEPDGQSTFVAWQRLHVNFEALASLRGEWVLGEISLDGLNVSVQAKPGGALNFSDLLEKYDRPSPGPGTDTPPRPLRIGRLNVTAATARFADQSLAKPFATTLGPVTFTLSDFHTGGKHDAPYRFEAETDAGEKLRWSGSIQAAPFRSRGEFRIENLPLAKYEPYHGRHLLAHLAEGRIGVSGRYEINLAANARTLSLTDGAVQLRGLRILDRTTQEPVFELPVLDLAGLNADAVSRQVGVTSISVVGGFLRARREKDGSINLLGLITPPPAPPPSTPPPATPTPPPGAPSPANDLPQIAIGEFTLRECALEVLDFAAPRPVRLSLTALQFAIQHVSLAEGATMPLQLSFNWAPRGTVRASGSVSVRPTVTATLETEVAGLDVLPLSPYLEQFVNARMTQGTVSTKNTVKVTAGSGVPVATFAGDIRVEKVGLVDSVRNEELAGVGSLSLGGLRVNTAAPGRVEIAEIKVNGPSARITLAADKTLNLAALAKPPATPAPVRASPAAPPPQIMIGKVVVEAGDFSFTDRSVTPEVRSSLGRIGGTIAGLSSENMARADVALTGVVDGTGPVSITGKLDPLGARRFVDLKIEGKNVDLVAFSPYSGQFAGFELARGKLGLDIQVRVDGPALDTANVVRLDRLTFGAPVASPTATKLPVRLGVALLKDLDGRIVIDLPIQGRLDDPEFKVGRVVGRVLVNLLTKAAVSPFTLLGSMFGGGGEELAYQEFAPGSSTLRPAELPKLQTMIKALSNRPELSLALEGSFDQAADTHALKRGKLSDRVRRTLWEQKRAQDPNTPPPEALIPTPEEEAGILKKLYDEQFPPGTTFGTALPAPPEVVAPPPPPAGFFQRIVRSFTGRSKKEELAARTENERRAAEHRQAVERALSAGRPLDEMLGRLAETIVVEPADLEALATARAQQVRDHFIAQGQLAADRFFLAKGADAASANRGPRVFLSLQ